MKIRFSTQHQASDVSQGMKVPYAAERRTLVQWRWYLILALVVSPFIFLLYKMVLPFILLTAPGFISLEKETFTAPTESAVEHVYVQSGDKVQSGQLLVELTAPKLDDHIRLLQTAQETGDSTASTPVDASRRQNTVTLYRQLEQQAIQAVAYQQQRLDTVMRIFEQQAATVAEVNAVRAQLDGAQHTLIQARLDLIAAEHPPSAMTAIEKELLQNRQQPNELVALQTQQQQLKIRASHPGTVLELPVERGKILVSGQSVILIGHQEQPQVIVYLRPELVKLATPGTLVKVNLPGGQSLKAKLREIPSQVHRLPAELSSSLGTRNVMVLMTLDLLDPLPAEEAIEGLPVEVRFHHSWQI